MPRFAACEELSSGQLSEIPTQVTHDRISAVCAHHKNKWVSPLMELFIDLCRKYMGMGWSSLLSHSQSLDFAKACFAVLGLSHI